MQYQKLISPAVSAHEAVRQTIYLDSKGQLLSKSIVQFSFNLSFPCLVCCCAKPGLFLFSLRFFNSLFDKWSIFFNMYAENRCPGSSCEATLALSLSKGNTCDKAVWLPAGLSLNYLKPSSLNLELLSITRCKLLLIFHTFAILVLGILLLE